jgi:cytoskeletal protein CcmA (bactofilin family)
MFNAKSKSDSVIGASAGNTLIGAGTTIKGDLISNGDVRIDGTLIGNISGSAKVLIGQEGVVQGDIEDAGKLQIEPSVTFNGQCHMGKEASVVEMAPDELIHAIAK